MQQRTHRSAILPSYPLRLKRQRADRNSEGSDFELFRAHLFIYLRGFAGSYKSTKAQSGALEQRRDERSLLYGAHERRSLHMLRTDFERVSPKFRTNFLQKGGLGFVWLWFSLHVMGAVQTFTFGTQFVSIMFQRYIHL